MNSPIVPRPDAALGHPLIDGSAPLAAAAPACAAELPGAGEAPFSHSAFSRPAFGPAFRAPKHLESRMAAPCPHPIV